MSNAHLVWEQQERSTRLFCSVFISDLAQAITDACGSKQGPVSYTAINTAKIFFQRFYMNQSLAKQKNFKVFLSGLFEAISISAVGVAFAVLIRIGGACTANKYYLPLRRLQDRRVQQIAERIHLGMEQAGR